MPRRTKINAIERWKEAQHVERGYWTKVRKEYDDRIKRKQWRQWILEPFNLTFSSFEDKIVIQIGCGPQGLINFLTVNPCGMKIGIDPLMGAYLRTYNMPINNHYIVATAEWLPIKNNTVDVVVCINMLDHTISPEKTLNEISRILRDGGLLIFQVNLSPLFKGMVESIFKKLSFTDIVAHPHKINVEWLVGRLTRLKFRIIKSILDDPWWHKKKSVDRFDVIDRLLFLFVQKPFAAGIRILAIKETKTS